MNSQALWYLTRGTGAASLVLLTLSVVLGMSGAAGGRIGRWPRFFTTALHRSVSLLVVVLLAVHIVTAVLDTFVSIRLADAVIPFGGTYRPLWLGFGALAFDLLLALIVTSLLRARLGLVMWRGVHWLAYACWPVALLHGLGTGTDASHTWMLALTIACVASAGAAGLHRLRQSDVAAGVRARVVGGAGAGLALVTVFALAGPLAPGWARKSGTPPPPPHVAQSTPARSTS